MDSHGDRQKTSAGMPVWRGDVAWNVPEPDTSDPLSLAPPDPEVTAHRRELHEALLPKPEAEQPESSEPDPFQFSLRHVLLAQTALAVLFALAQFLVPSLLAGMLGVSVLLMAVMMTIFRHQERSVWIVWWSALMLYIAACVLASVML